MPRVQSASAWWLVAIGSIAAVLVVTSIVINVVLDSSDDELLPADTPEGAVQQYLQALVDDDYAEAFAYVSETLQDCTLQHFIQITEFRRERDFSATLGRTTSIDDITLVTVKITEPSFDIPFGRGENSFDTVFTLAEEEGQWRFSEPPWPMAWCPPERATPEPPKVEPSAQQAPRTYGEGWVS